MPYFVLPFLFTLLFLPAGTHAADPDRTWMQIETKNFLVIFDRQYQELGKRYALYAEQAHAAIAPIFEITPAKTILLIDDGTDLANGYATGVPYPMIVTYPVLPNSAESISDYGNWGLELLTHEYVHILSFEPATGLARPFRWIFGSIIRPNILLPRWYLEGLAVELETRFSSFGRLRSANYLSVARAMALDGSLRNEDIARINESSIPGWPGGVRPYLLGALLWNEMIRLGGDGTIKTLNLAYSRRLPFFINGPPRSLLGADYATLLARAYARIEDNVRKQLAVIQAASTPRPSTDRELKQTGHFNRSPVLSPDQEKLVFVGRADNNDDAIFLTKRLAMSSPDILPEKLATGTAITRASWFPDSMRFVYDSIHTFDRYYEFSDLSVFDLRNGKSRKISSGLRAREPVVSPDGKWIVFVQNTPGSTRLAAIETASASGNMSGGGASPCRLAPVPCPAFRVLYTPPLQTRLAWPEFLSNDEVIFSEKRDDGNEVFKVLPVSALLTPSPRNPPMTVPSEVLSRFMPVHFPRRTHAGLLFVSDRSGVANLYLANADLSDARAITNSTTRAMMGDLDSRTSELIFAQLTANGPRIFSMPRLGWEANPPLPPTVGPLTDYEWPKYEPPSLVVEAATEVYNPVPHLLPRYWMPYVYIAPEGSYFQASTTGGDPVGIHAYSIAAAYDTLTEQPSFLLGYTNGSTDIPLSIQGSDYYDYFYGSDLIHRTRSLSVSGRFHLPRLSNDWQGGLGWHFLRDELRDGLGNELSAGSTERQGARASLRWSDASQQGREISPEKGGAVEIGYGQYFSDTEGLSYGQVDLFSSLFFSGWLPDHHVLAVSLNASIADDLESNLLGQSNLSSNYQSSMIRRGFVVRGYHSGVFFGRNMIASGLEYRFPILESYRGFGTAPIFLQRWHGDVFVDAVTLDGYAYDADSPVYRRTSLGSFYVGTGAELKADVTLFYHVPVQFILGLYYGTDKAANPYGLFPFVGFGL